ncbi:transposase [sulfur-oxidizing endosymbiont of Gigantopelta aegis]|uniref:transposase n=1 Tax=sulfur-oxidizing endosymbiont of Gigantopelta aegis TaxID=2794934 RepID=UPI0018DE3CB7|nr:transposase [sulfur-oxidizing endosymbiont of Gigantopelta aegis]
MPTPRSQQISLSDTPYYHCISRCVRRTFLCGIDSVTNKDYSYRKQWFIERLALLSKTFAIDVCAYAIMSNHLHTVLKINASLAQSWSDETVIQHWQQLCSIPVLVDRYLNGKCHSKAEQNRAQETIAVFRDRLMDISWFMRCLNEHIARRANAEDKCTGRFWEGRFKSQALLDEQAILSCMVYVDLNPIRADISQTLEDSDYTSVKQRIDSIKKTKSISKKITQQSTATIKLAPFIGSSLKYKGIAFDLNDYLELAEWTGRIKRDDKRGYIKSGTPAILQKLQLNEDTWLETVDGFSKGFHSFVGPEEQLKSLCLKQKRHWVRGINLCRKLFKINSAAPITT